MTCHYLVFFFLDVFYPTFFYPLRLTNPFAFIYNILPTWRLSCPVVVLCYISVSYILHESRNGTFEFLPSLIICVRLFLVLSYYKIPLYMLLIDSSLSLSSILSRVAFCFLFAFPHFLGSESLEFYILDWTVEIIGVVALCSSYTISYYPLLAFYRG